MKVRARDRVVFFCEACQAQGPEGDSVSQAADLWNTLQCSYRGTEVTNPAITSPWLTAERARVEIDEAPPRITTVEQLVELCERAEVLDWEFTVRREAGFDTSYEFSASLRYRVEHESSDLQAVLEAAAADVRGR